MAGERFPEVTFVPTQPLLNERLHQLLVRPEDRRFVESLWQMYQPYAGSDFRERFATQMQQHFWEMYLTCALLRQGKQVLLQPNPKKGRRGPDVKVQESDQIIWLEATAVTHGTGANAVPRYECGPGKPIVAYDVPDEEMVLRYTSALKTKFEKYEGYDDTILAASDMCMIAISAGELDHRYTEMLYPRILHALFPIGNYAVTINTTTMETTQERHQYRDRIRKIPTTFFATDAHAKISAVLFSYSDICNPPVVLGNDFVVVHNPFAINPLPRGWLKLGREFWVEDNQIAPHVEWFRTARHVC
jgi:hypothetical protein